jgi:hypothetical protein
MPYLIENECGLYQTGKWDKVNRKRLSWDILATHGGDIKKILGSLSSLETWGPGVDGYSCLFLNSHTHV